MSIERTISSERWWPANKWKITMFVRPMGKNINMECLKIAWCFHRHTLSFCIAQVVKHGVVLNAVRFCYNQDNYGF